MKKKIKKIAIIGASYLQLPLVEKAKALGIETHCFAWAKGAVCKDICDYFYDISTLEKELILAKCSEINIDGIMTIASDIAVPTVCFVAEKMNLVGNNYDISVITTDKFLMRNAFINAGICSPKYQLIKNKTDIKHIEHLAFPLIVKPTDRSGSRGVQKVNNKSELQEAIENALTESFSGQAIVEEFIEGVEVSVESISWKGAHYVLAITDKITSGEPDFVELQHHQPSCIEQLIQEKIQENTIRALDSLVHQYGASHAEFKIDNNGTVYIIEVGARMGGDFIGSDLVFLSTGYDYLKACIDISLNEFQKPELKNHNYAGVYFLCEEYAWLEDLIIKNNEQYIYKAEVQIDEIKNAHCSADRSGYLIYKSDKRIKLL